MSERIEARLMEQEEAERRGECFTMIPAQTMNEMAENTRRMGEMILQLGSMMSTMRRRLDDLEAKQAAVTIRHADVKRLQGLIRGRADEICRKYGLTDRESPKAFRAAIRKDLLKRFLLKDLHDLPERALGQAEALVDTWANIRLVMERKEALRHG